MMSKARQTVIDSKDETRNASTMYDGVYLHLVYSVCLHYAYPQATLPYDKYTIPYPSNKLRPMTSEKCLENSMHTKLLCNEILLMLTDLVCLLLAFS